MNIVVISLKNIEKKSREKLYVFFQICYEDYKKPKCSTFSVTDKPEIKKNTIRFSCIN